MHHAFSKKRCGVAAIKDQMPVKGWVHPKRPQSAQSWMPKTAHASQLGEDGQQLQSFIKVVEISRGDGQSRLLRLPPVLQLEIADEPVGLLNREAHRAGKSCCTLAATASKSRLE